MKWKDVTNNFSEEARHYNGKYLEIDYVLDGWVEASLFSSDTMPYEIYFSYGVMYGIIYTTKENGLSLLEEVKEVLREDYINNKEPSDKFIEDFCNKYKVCIPSDVLFNEDAFMNSLIDSLI